MSTKNRVDEEIRTFIESWPGEPQLMRDCFKRFYQELRTMDGVELSFVARPGVSFSLRPRHTKMSGREFFAIVDVIDADPEKRWLSVCFYEDMISDPNELGECIPGGLAGSNGYCFDLDDTSCHLVDYLVARLQEAWAAAAG